MNNSLGIKESLNLLLSQAHKTRESNDELIKLIVQFQEDGEIHMSDVATDTIDLEPDYAKVLMETEKIPFAKEQNAPTLSPNTSPVFPPEKVLFITRDDPCGSEVAILVEGDHPDMTKSDLERDPERERIQPVIQAASGLPISPNTFNQIDLEVSRNSRPDSHTPTVQKDNEILDWLARPRPW